RSALPRIRCGRRARRVRFWRRSSRFGLLDEPQRGSVKVAQFRFAWFIAGEFDQIATREELAQASFLVREQQIGALQFVEEFFSGSLGGAEIKAVFQILANRVGYQDAKFARLAK